MDLHTDTEQVFLGFLVVSPELAETGLLHTQAQILDVGGGDGARVEDGLNDDLLGVRVDRTDLRLVLLALLLAAQHHHFHGEDVVDLVDAEEEHFTRFQKSNFRCFPSYQGQLLFPSLGHVEF